MYEFSMCDLKRAQKELRCKNREGDNMKIYYMERGGGKTTKCILELAKNPHASLIVQNSAIGRRIVKENQGIKNIEDRVFSAQSPINWQGLDKDRYFIIDDIDNIATSTNLNHLTSLFKSSRIKFATASMRDVSFEDGAVVVQF